MQLPGGDPTGPTVADSERYAKLFDKGALPKLQSFKAATHSDGKRMLIVGGR